MARRPRLFAPGILYHVIVRGNYRQKTFLNARDYQAYLERLGRYRKKFGVTVYAYCLMSNHVHLLVETGFQSISKDLAAGRPLADRSRGTDVPVRIFLIPFSNSGDS